MFYIGVDPGKTGAVAVIRDNTFMQVGATPVIGTSSGRNAYDMIGMRSMISMAKQWAKHHKQNIIAGIEVQQAYPNQGGVSNFSTGHGFGLWQGIVCGLDIHQKALSVRDWRHAIFTEEERKAFDLWPRVKGVKLSPKQKRENKEHRKFMMVSKAKDLWPAAAKYIEPTDDGKAEALLIADATQRIYGV